jgi:RNA polymerase sigma-70 factor (ECF subfamily)
VLSVAEPVGRSGESGERFDELFRRLYGRLYGLGYRLVGDAHEAEDLLQEAFLKLADHSVLERPDEEVAAWLRRVVLNLGANRLRERRRARERLERVGRLEVGGATVDADGPSGIVLRDEEQATVRAALGHLPGRQRDCLLLRHAGHSYAEIAATLGVAVGSVGVLLARAERAFKQAYREDVPRGGVRREGVRREGDDELR